MNTPAACMPSVAAAARASSHTPVSVTWKIQREVALLLGWGRAILLQLSHPLVAAGIDEHSTFLGAGERARRLRRTIKSMLALTFGEPHEAAGAARTINGIHDRVHGKLTQRAGIFPPGTPYSAHDPELLGWVHATLVESFLKTYEHFVAPLSQDEKDRYCSESAELEFLLGIPEGYLPRNSRALRVYMSGMFASGQIAVTETARRLSREVLHPPLPLILQPLLAFFRFSTIGMLPPPVRKAYGLEWNQRKEKRLGLAGDCVRRTLPLLPPVIRYWKSYRMAVRRFAQLNSPV